MTSASRPKANELEIWSFFTGGMGLDLGLEQAGLSPTLANEVDPAFCKTIRRNRPKLTLLECDIRTLSRRALAEARNLPRRKDIFLMVGGPPCQSFSTGGKRGAILDPRGNLIFEYLRLIQEAQPSYFVLENVASLANAALQHRPIHLRPGQHWNLKAYDRIAQNGNDGFLPLSADEKASSAVKRILDRVSKLGYAVKFGILDAADYGAPQHRLRFVMLGARDGACPELPVPTHGEDGLLKPFVTVRDAIWSLRNKPGAHSEYTPPVKKIFEQVPEGKNWRSLPLKLQKLALGKAFLSGGGKTGFFRRLAWDRPAPTITGRANRKASALCHPELHRPLSVLECAVLQGFPLDWFEGSMNTQYTQIGNAVPVHLGQAIGKSILEPNHWQQHSAASANFDQMLDRAVARLRAAARNKRAAGTSFISLEK